MLDTYRYKCAKLGGTPLDLKDLLAIFLLRAKVNTQTFLRVSLSQVKQMDLVVVTHVCCGQIFSILAKAEC